MLSDLSKVNLSLRNGSFWLQIVDSFHSIYFTSKLKTDALSGGHSPVPSDLEASKSQMEEGGSIPVFLTPRAEADSPAPANQPCSFLICVLSEKSPEDFSRSML